MSLAFNYWQMERGARRLMIWMVIGTAVILALGAADYFAIPIP